jgi:hypothetical protein
MYQESIKIDQAFGVPGQIFTDGPHRAEVFTLISALAAYNKVGATAFTVSSQAIAAAGNVGGNRVFAGVLVNPQSYVLYGTQGGGPLSPSLTLPNNSRGELMTMGTFIAQLANTVTANIGDLVIFNNTTGALSSIAPGVPTPNGYSNAIGIVDYFTSPNQPGIAVVTLTYNPATFYLAPAPFDGGASLENRKTQVQEIVQEMKDQGLVFKANDESKGADKLSTSKTLENKNDYKSAGGK